jgi:hypothetical protein
VIEADQGARWLDLGVNHGIATASIVEDAEAASFGPSAGLGKGTALYYLQHGKVLPVSEALEALRDGSASDLGWRVGGLRVAGEPASSYPAAAA